MMPPTSQPAKLDGTRPCASLEHAPTGKDPYSPIVNSDPSKPFVVAQLGQSLDGRIATSTGESRWINKDAALDHVHRLRASVDAVVVGVGTVTADDPILNVRRVQGRNPARVIIDPSGRLPENLRCMTLEDGARRILIRTVEAPVPKGVEVIRIDRSGERLDPLAIVAALHATGLRTMLIEGGAWTVSAFIDAGAIDRLHILVAPMILGSGKTGLALRPIERLTEARRPAAQVHLLSDGDVLFDCDLRTEQA